MTTDRQAFIAGISAAPDDDLPRLVFADWLEEHGEPERAEFIRVQCALARLPECDCERLRRAIILVLPDESPCRPHCGRHALCGRERELLNGENHNWEKWSSFIPVGFPCSILLNGPNERLTVSGEERGILFRRGFVEEVRMPWNREHIAAIREATPLRKVVLTTWPHTLYRVLDRRGATTGFCFQGSDKIHKAPDMADCLADEFPGVEIPLPPTWQYYATQYTSIDRDDLMRQIRRAVGEPIFRPPILPPESP